MALSKLSIENLSLINFIQLLTLDFLPAIVPLIPSDDKITVPFTDFDKRYAFANKPVKVFGFKPNIEKDYSIMEDHIDDRLKDIFKLYKLRG